MIEHAKPNTIGLITQLEDGSIIQLGLTEEQNSMLQVLVASMSKDKPLVRLPEEYNLRLENEIL